MVLPGRVVSVVLALLAGVAFAETPSAEDGRDAPSADAAAAEAGVDEVIELDEEPPPAPAARRRAPAVEEIIVTATKRGPARVQDVPIAITAFGPEQLERMNFRNLRSLTYAMPNVQLEDIGTFQGYASFSIRGQGINSSIPSVDPTVGVFVDGVYMGSSAGLVVDNFDLEGIEVLRGPQGVLFGRNVTGGAILLRTKTPGDVLEFSGRAGAETGVRKFASVSLSGPLVGDAWSGKLAVYASDTPGWFTNLADGSDHGASRVVLARAALRMKPDEGIGGILRIERGDTAGDGPAGQNRAVWGRGSFNFAINRPGYTDTEWTGVTLEPQIGIGPGTLTSVTGWREFGMRAELDVDSTTDDGFFGQILMEQEQFSEELRYAGSFGGSFDYTVGLYYFTQDLLYIERRQLFEQTVDRTGGGDGRFSTAAGFGALDWRLAEAFSLSFGLRYTLEKKAVEVSTIGTTRTDSGGDVERGTLNPNFVDQESWSDVSPRVGFQWQAAARSQVYGSWAKGFRSGGYNFRNTTDNPGPGPFDSEEQDSFELGFKHDFSAFPLRINAAAFHTRVVRLQRELNAPGSFGVSQIIVNAGDARIAGAEAETQLLLPAGFTLSLFGGLLDGKYLKVTADLNRDGEVDAADKALEIPRLAPRSWGAMVQHDMGLGQALRLLTRIAYSRRDRSFFTDTNAGYFDPWEGINIDISIAAPSRLWSLDLYVHNLKNRPSLGGDTVLPDDDPPLFFLFGGDGPGPRESPTFSPLNPGRVFGAQLRVSF